MSAITLTKLTPPAGAIARQLGVRHPGEQNYGTPIVITLDFFLSKIAANGKKLLEANDCKYTDDLDERSFEKLEIARRWCEKHNISWALVTEQEIDSELVANLRFIDDSRPLDAQGQASSIDAPVGEASSTSASTKERRPMKQPRRSLVTISRNAAKNKLSVHDALRRAGFIRDITTPALAS